MVAINRENIWRRSMDGYDGRLVRKFDDAQAGYEEGGQRLRMVIELDRSTCPLGDIADQLRHYP